MNGQTNPFHERKKKTIAIAFRYAFP